MSIQILIVTAVEAEAAVINKHEEVHVIASGIGRTNAAIATTTAILNNGPFNWILNLGLAGSLPESNLQIGDVVISNSCIYMEEGLMTPAGFQDIQSMGFSLGKFDGNRVPINPLILEPLKEHGIVGSIATVATCSGTDEQSNSVHERTGAICEAMEGAAVVHAAMHMNIPAIEIRVISNTTGNRQSQIWDLKRAFAGLEKIASKAINALLNHPEQSSEVS